MSIAVVAGVGLVGACLAIARVPNLVENPGRFLVLFSFAFACYAAAIWWLPHGNGSRTVFLVITVGVAARLALLPALPTLSTDAYRYVWDARVAHAGFSPYAYPPLAPELEALRDTEIFPRLNHPTWRTIYPPGAEAFFQLVYRVGPDNVWAMKVAVGLAELVGIATVFGLLRAAGRPLSQAAIYVWNPLVLVEVWGMAHVDGIIVPAVAGAGWMALRGWNALAGALLGVAALVKLYPATLLVLLPATGWIVAIPSFLGVVLGGYAPAFVTATATVGSLPQYLTDEYFNPGLVRSLVDSPNTTLVSAALWVTLIGAMRRRVALPVRAVMLTGGLVVLSPNIFPWYGVWLVPFLAWSPSLPWVAFTGTVAFAYAFFLRDPWAIPAWARVLEFAPLAFGVLWWGAEGIARKWRS